MTISLDVLLPGNQQPVLQVENVDCGLDSIPDHSMIHSEEVTLGSQGG